MQGKFPLLVLPDGKALPESEVIVQYLLNVYKDVGPSLTASDPYAQAVAALVTRIHDLYIGPIQGSMYRAMPSAEQRAKDIATIAYQLDAIEVSTNMAAGLYYPIYSSMTALVYYQIVCALLHRCTTEKNVDVRCSGPDHKVCMQVRDRT